MARIFYVHWNQDEARAAVARIRQRGHSVEFHWDSRAHVRSKMMDPAPDAIVISLARLPAHGRAVAEAVRNSKRNRLLPIVFVGGHAEKVAAMRSLFPTAQYCAEPDLAEVLQDPGLVAKAAGDEDALAVPGPERRVGAQKADSASGYSGTPLPKKLGIKPDSRVAILNAPRGFRRALGALPPGVAVTDRLVGSGRYNVVVLFVPRYADLKRSFRSCSKRIEPNGGLWVAWPKKASGVATDVSEDRVREHGLAVGLVDNKICAIDSIWSGLHFVFRTKDRPALRR